MLGAGDGLLEIVVEAQIQLDDALSPTKRRLSACSRSRGVGSRKLSDDETSELHVPVPTGAVVLPLDCAGPGVLVADEDLGIARPGLRCAPGDGGDFGSNDAFPGAARFRPQEREENELQRSLHAPFTSHHGDNSL